MEVVAGARTSAHERELRRLMVHGGLLHFEAVTDFDAAALIYGAAGRPESPPRGMVYCTIAAVAWAEAPACSASTLISNG